MPEINSAPKHLRTSKDVIIHFLMRGTFVGMTVRPVIAKRAVKEFSGDTTLLKAALAHVLPVSTRPGRTSNGPDQGFTVGHRGPKRTPVIVLPLKELEALHPGLKRAYARVVDGQIVVSATRAPRAVAVDVAA